MSSQKIMEPKWIVGIIAALIVIIILRRKIVKRKLKKLFGWPPQP